MMLVLSFVQAQRNYLFQYLGSCLSLIKVSRQFYFAGQSKVTVCAIRFVILQHLLLLVRCIHQSMLIMMTLSTELRAIVPTVRGIQHVTFQEVYMLKIIFSATAHTLNWLILNLAKTSTVVVTFMCGVLGVMSNCCSYSHKSLLDYHHTALLQ